MVFEESTNISFLKNELTSILYLKTVIGDVIISKNIWTDLPKGYPAIRIEHCYDDGNDKYYTSPYCPNENSLKHNIVIQGNTIKADKGIFISAADFPYKISANIIDAPVIAIELKYGKGHHTITENTINALTWIIYFLRI